MPFDNFPIFILECFLLLCSDVSDEEPAIISKPLQQSSIDSPEQKLVTTSAKPPTVKSADYKPIIDIDVPSYVQPASVIHNPVQDNIAQKQKRILVVPNHQQSVMSNLSSLWKAGQLCDAFISNGTVNVKVNTMKYIL